MKDKPYNVEVDNNGCNCCGRAKTWVIVDPDDIAGGTSYDDEEEAEYLAEMLNDAYERGKQSVTPLSNSEIKHED